MTPVRAEFVMMTCQTAAAPVVKAEVAARWPDFRFAYSRPGFLTFRLPENHRLRADFELGCAFVRSHAFSLGRIAGDDDQQRAAAAWEMVKSLPIERVHVWSRDRCEPGYRGFEPRITEEDRRIHRLLIDTRPGTRMPAEAEQFEQPAEPGELVFDCVVVDPGVWYAGFHRVGPGPSQYPGGLWPLVLPENAVSRAWLKMEEALRWSQLPIGQGARVAEIGSAPGGASQALLARGCHVLGIDPAEMDASVLAHPNFTHLRKRSTHVRRREFRKIRWLVADMNVAPNYTLSAVEGIVTHSEVSVRGLILTLKLIEWEMASRVGEYLDRVRGWGYNIVRARQLQFNRRELCVAALQKPFQRKS